MNAKEIAVKHYNYLVREEEEFRLKYQSVKKHEKDINQFAKDQLIEVQDIIQTLHDANAPDSAYIGGMRNGMKTVIRKINEQIKKLK